jgi:DNA-binding NtrC family response regulator
VDVWQLPAGIRKNSEEPVVVRSYEDEVRQFKRRLLLRTLEECGWRKAESARSLGVARGYLHRLINQLDLRPAEENTITINSHEKLPIPMKQAM